MMPSDMIHDWIISPPGRRVKVHEASFIGACARIPRPNQGVKGVGMIVMKYLFIKDLQKSSVLGGFGA